MKEYNFTLTFALPDVDNNPEYVIDALFEAGCDDATIGIGETGVIALDFIREADTAEKAVSSSIENVKQAIDNARLIEVSPDLVNLTDIANEFRCSRQNIRKYAINYNKNFPYPVYGGGTPLWHLQDIVQYFNEHSSKINIPSELLELSKVALVFNLKNQQERYKKYL